MRARFLFLIIAAVIATLPLTGCGGGGGGSGAPTVASNSFVQADLAGTWNIIIFATGPEVAAGTQPGWTRGSVTVDTSGHLTFAALTANAPFGSIPLPAPGAAIWTMDANGNGVVTSGGVGGGLLGMQGFMAGNKQVIVGTVSVTANSRAMVIAVKQVPGVTFTTADVTGPMSFNSHLLRSGASTDWDYFTGTIDPSSQVTFTSYITTTGPVVPLPVANAGTITIDSTGLVHLLSDPSFEGVMTPDKKVIFATFTDTDTGANIYHLDVILLGGQTFTTADLAGTWRYQTLVSSPLWEYGTFSIAGTGIGTLLSLTDSNGNATVPAAPNNSFTFTINAAGNIANPSDQSLFGTMAFNKQMIVSTSTRSGGGAFNLSIALKK